jgi:hypothetical protein
MRLGPRTGLLPVILAGVLVAPALSALAYAAGGKPTITNVSVSHVTNKGATVTAVINPKGSKTKYELLLHFEETCGPSPSCKPPLGRKVAGMGTLRTSDKSQRVSVLVTGLEPHKRYGADFQATNSSGKTIQNEGKIFTTK